MECRLAVDDRWMAERQPGTETESQEASKKKERIEGTHRKRWMCLLLPGGFTPFLPFVWIVGKDVCKNTVQAPLMRVSHLCQKKYSGIK